MSIKIPPYQLIKKTNTVIIISDTYSSLQQYTKVLYETFPIEEIIRCKQEVPTQHSEPWEIERFVYNVTNGDDFMKTFDLYHQCLKNKHKNKSDRNEIIICHFIS